MQTGVSYEDVSIRPDWRQLLIDELLSILAAVVLLIVGGLDGVPYHSVFFCVALALGFKVYYRIVDFDEKRSFLQLILGLKTVVVHSGDRTMPKLLIIGIREQNDIVTPLRERVSYNRKRMNIHEFANYR